MTGWIDALAVRGAAHEAEFLAACEEAVEPHDATVVPREFLRVRLRDSAHEVILLFALSSTLHVPFRPQTVSRLPTSS
jgi:hypothetical protein